MMTDHRVIHAPAFQVGMNQHRDRPLCWRAEDDGVTSCVCCATPEMHEIHLAHTPGCQLCARGQRAAYLYWTYAR